MNEDKLKQVNDAVNALTEMAKVATQLGDPRFVEAVGKALTASLNARGDIEDATYGVSREVIEAFRRAGFRVARYSGRGMYGRYCVGAILDSLESAIAKVGRYVENPDSLKGMRTDSLGLDMVAYWPHLSWPPDVEEDADE